MAHGREPGRIVLLAGCVGAIATAVIATGPATSAAPDPPPEPEPVTELTLGDWVGIGVASGVATASGPNGSLIWKAGFEAPFRMTVTENATTGTFTLTSSGLNGAPAMTMTLNAGDAGSFDAEWNVSPPAQGTIDGDRSLLVFNTGTVTTAGTIQVPGIGAQAIEGIPSQVSIENNIEHLECNIAYGDWDVSVVQQIENEGWDASWQGGWAAFQIPDPDADVDPEELIDGLEELFTDFNEFSLTATGAIDPDAEYDPATIDRAQLMNLAARATEMTNRLANLSPCDAAAIGAETLQEWQTVLARGVADLVLAAADVVAALGDDVYLDYEALNGLILAADTTGAYGAGSSLDAGVAFQVEDALVYLTGQSVQGNLAFADGRYESCQDFACRNDHYLWAAGGVSEAATHGWSITVNGRTYGPSEVGDVLSNPPEHDG